MGKVYIFVVYSILIVRAFSTALLLVFDFLKDVKYLVNTLPKTQVNYLGFFINILY